MSDSTQQESLGTGPFAGLVVIELGNSVAAPFAGQILGELGARVIKIEKADGDDARRWGPPFWEGASPFFQALNRNKKSVVCDLRDPQQIEELRQYICEHADIVIQNLRPGHVEKLGLDAASLLAIQPRLIYCNLGAFGKVGPLKDRPGYDPLMQAFGGIMSTTGEPGRPSVRVGASIVDMGTGMWGIIGILTALLERQQTGVGKVIDVSLYETATTWVSLLAAQYLSNGEVAAKQGSGASGIVPYKGYMTSDGELVIAAGSDALFKALSSTVGKPEWVADARFIDNPRRVEHQQALYAMLDAIIATKPTDYWVEQLEAAGVPCAPVNNLAQMVAHPQTEALGLMQDVPGTGMRFIGLPISFDGVRPKPYAAPPKLGEHSTLISKRKAT
ncbi:MAG: CoA transferase [Burkholderiaceae bacterium]|nr:CoA transferase [Burkholderiaceae bacterium]